MNSLEKKLKNYQLTFQEYERICELLGRAPEGVEWAVFSALWSEHCSYKSSKWHLRQFSSTLNKRVLQSEGENAGVVDLGQGERVVFKMESHNHPSFIYPYHGAATGVGGILRDIFTMGAKPIALADYLCFGSPEDKGTPTLLDGVVRGIGDYGNSVGVPTITGSTEFHRNYRGNILVNAFALGLLGPNDRVQLSAAKGIGNKVVYVGAKTGGDGIHGATMASSSFEKEEVAGIAETSEATETSEVAGTAGTTRTALGEKLSCVQVGDPFLQKLLIEACLEVMRENLVESIQDMGAAGLTSSAFEMCEKGKVGMELHLDKVPLRDSSLGPEEILLSESQERMLLVCKPSNYKDLCAVFEKWGLDIAPIGKICKEQEVKLFWKGSKLTALAPKKVVCQAPVYQRPYEVILPKEDEGDSLKGSFSLHLKEKNLWQNLCLHFSHLALTPKPWIYSQYDQRVGAKTLWDASHSLALLRLPHSGRLLGISLGCRPSLMRLHCQWGAMDAIVFPTLKMAIKGLKSLAFTDCLNFGNPEDKKVMGDFVLSVQSITKACCLFETPVVSGNVSFYNESKGVGLGNIDPTPATACVGLMEQKKGDEGQDPQDFFLPQDTFAGAKAGDALFLLHCPQLEYASLTAEIHNFQPKFHGALDLSALKALRDLLLEWVQSSGTSLRASRMVEEGGFLCTLLKMSLSSSSNPLGLSLNPLELKKWSSSWESESFKEFLYQALFVVSKEKEDVFISNFNKLKGKHQVKPLSLFKIGICLEEPILRVGLESVALEGKNSRGGGDGAGDSLEEKPLSELKAIYRKAWKKHFPSL